MEFDEVTVEDFSRLQGPFSFLEIEASLVELGGEGVEGVNFRKAALKAAGWRHHDLISYGKFPDQAASAFNRVRLVLQQTQEPDAILAQLKAKKAAS